MNFTTLKVSFVSAAALALSASQGFAQNNNVVSVKVPFDFVAGPTVLPAGNYSFHEERSGVLYINSPERHKGIVVLTSPEASVTTSETSAVRFDMVNGQYSLTEVKMAGEPTYHLIRSEEKSAAMVTRLGVTNATAKSLR